MPPRQWCTAVVASVAWVLVAAAGAKAPAGSGNSFDPSAFLVGSAAVGLATTGSSVPEEASSIAAAVAAILDKVVAAVIMA